MSFRVASESIQPAALHETLANTRAGACVTFEGWVRNHNEGHKVRHLEYEAFEEMADFDCAFPVTDFHLYVHDGDHGWRATRDFVLTGPRR